MTLIPCYALSRHTCRVAYLSLRCSRTDGRSRIFILMVIASSIIATVHTTASIIDQTVTYIEPYFYSDNVNICHKLLCLQQSIVGPVG